MQNGKIIENGGKMINKWNSKDDYNDYDDNNDIILPDLLQCVDNGVKYKSRPRDKLQKIKNIESADLCRQICSETDGCRYWTWIQKPRKTVCRLRADIIKSGFRRKKNNAVSGTLLNGCNLTQNGGNGGDDFNSISENSQYCVEYGAIYTSGSERPTVVPNLNSEIECRNKCIQTNSCKYFTWKTGKRKNNCELRSNDDFEVKAVKPEKGTSGSVLGRCRDQSLDQMTQCNCVNLNNQNQPGGINSDRPSLVDILGQPGGLQGDLNSNRPSLINILNGAGFDGRSANPEVARSVGNQCPNKNFINRCGFPVSTRDVSTTTQTPTTTPNAPRRGPAFCNVQEGNPALFKNFVAKPASFNSSAVYPASRNSSNVAPHSVKNILAGKPRFLNSS